MDVHREILHAEAVDGPEQPAAEDQPGQDGPGPDRLVDPVDRER